MLITSTEVAEELLTTIVQRDTVENGFETFRLFNFEGMETEFEESVFERVLAKLTHVKELQVAYMSYLT